MRESSRAQGWAICIGAGVLALIFLVGLLNQSYWALAIPVAILGFFALGLAAWVGFTIATIRVDAQTPIQATADEVGSETTSSDNNAS